MIITLAGIQAVDIKATSMTNCQVYLLLITSRLTASFYLKEKSRWSSRRRADPILYCWQMFNKVGMDVNRLSLKNQGLESPPRRVEKGRWGKNTLSFVWTSHFFTSTNNTNIKQGKREGGNFVRGWEERSKR